MSVTGGSGTDYFTGATILTSTILGGDGVDTFAFESAAAVLTESAKNVSPIKVVISNARLFPRVAASHKTLKTSEE